MTPLHKLTGLAALTALVTGCGGSSSSDNQTDTSGLIEPSAQEAVLYYQRDDGNYGNYDGWGLHLWNSDACSGVENPTDWAEPLLPAGVDPNHGAYYRVDLMENADCINFIMHRGDDKDLGGGDQMWPFADYGRQLFTVSGYQYLSSSPFDQPPVAISGASAHWLDRDTLVWFGDSPAEVVLAYSANAGIELNAQTGAISGGDTVTLSPTTLPSELQSDWPHLASSPAFEVDLTVEQQKDMLKGELIAVALNDSGAAIAATQVQTPGVLDDLYAYQGELGVAFDGNLPSFHLWAPTAKSVRLHVFDANKNLLAGYPVDMTAQDGVWSHEGDASLDRAYYQYEVEVFHPVTREVETLMATDPYAVSLSRNSQYAQVVNLNDDDLKPAGWDTLTPPAVANPEDIVVYESHVRDFSAQDSSVSEANRGKYLAFTETASVPMQHLADLTDAGISHLHLLPAFDIATVDEDPDARVDINDSFQALCDASAEAASQWSEHCGPASIRSVLEGFDPTTGDAQSLYDTLRNLDSFNWGYDPWHFTVPEGSYATDAEGTQRILEFRQMVQALSNTGLNVVMDVVYNHTNASGVNNKSVLDQIVPGYYHRRNPETGNVEQSSCCENTASEHAMMEKLMVDSLVVWAEQYQVSGFRFDLMGHHMRSNMLDALSAVQAVDPDTYFYGEAWNFGEVQDNARGINAIQKNMGGTGIGTFNDRARDAVRGGGPFDSGNALRQNQGFSNGLFVQPNDLNSGSADEKANALARADWIRSGITGGLADFEFEAADGNVKAAKDIDYAGQRLGYTDDPQELVNYVSKHDNQTLWDNNQYKAATSASTAQRARMQMVGLSVPILSQGIPFLHMGSEILRSKSMQRDSYDSGDWFNEVDFTLTSTAWNRGLPREDKDGQNWPLIQQILQDSNARPDTASMQASKSQFETLLSVRQSSPLFRLTTAAEVENRLTFLNTGPEQVPGVIAWTIDDTAGADLDPDRESVMVFINATPSSQTLNTGLSGYTLHPAMQAGDATTASASFAGGDVTVPAWTTAVFQQTQGE